MTTPDRDPLAVLRLPFPDHQVSLLPKQMKRGDEDRGKCGGRYSADGKDCGGYHARSIHLDYVGHAALTDRLLDADPLWTWEPVAFGPDGLPVMDKSGGLWIRLTVGGVTRLGYGDSQGKTGPNAVKEAIGDALRNAGMRFGAALDLWHKGDLHAAEVDRNDAEPAPSTPPVQEEARPGPTTPEDFLAALTAEESEARVHGLRQDAGLLDLLSREVAVRTAEGTVRVTLEEAFTRRRDRLEGRRTRAAAEQA